MAREWSSSITVSHGRGRRTRRGHHPQVELGVIGLPDLVGGICLPAVDQLEHLRVASAALDRQGSQRRVDAADDRVDGGVGRDRPSFPFRDLGDLPVHLRGGRDRRAQRQSLHQEPQRLGEAGPATVGAHGPAQASEPASPVAGQPPLQRPVRDPALRGDAGQRDAVLEVYPQSQPAAMCLRPAGLAKRGQRRLVRVRAASDRGPLPGRLRDGRCRIPFVRLQRPVQRGPADLQVARDSGDRLAAGLPGARATALLG